MDQGQQLAMEQQFPQLRTLPAKFFRVQYDGSFTKFYGLDGGMQLESNAHYNINHCHWLNAPKINRHLAWNDRSSELSPFISVYDNKGKRPYTVGDENALTSSKEIPTLTLNSVCEDQPSTKVFRLCGSRQQDSYRCT